jgi:hypothetical protein
MESDNKLPNDKPPIQYSKSPEFGGFYANNTFLEPSVWDMKMIFGQLDQQIGPSAIVQNVSITMPWQQVKILRYFLGLHLLAHEMQNGQIRIPPHLVPPIPEEFPSENAYVGFHEEKARELHTALRACYVEFLKKNPEAIPE